MPFGAALLFLPILTAIPDVNVLPAHQELVFLFLQDKHSATKTIDFTPTALHKLL